MGWCWIPEQCDEGILEQCDEGILEQSREGILEQFRHVFGESLLFNRPELITRLKN